MTTHKDIDSFIKALDQRIKKIVPNVVAETATEFFKERFRTKEWDGSPWAPAKRMVKKGSLMVQSSKLVNSIRPSLVTSERVRISAGNAKVPYAQIHNEGGEIMHPGGTAYLPTKDKRFTWVSNRKAAGKNLPRTRPHRIKIPRRKFMGHSDRLNRRIYDRIVDIINE